MLSENADDLEKRGQVLLGKGYLLKDVNEQHQIARHWLQQGQLSQAANIYLNILEAQPDDFNATHMLGVIACQMDDFDTSIAIIKKAIGINSNFPPAYSNLAFALRKASRFQESIEFYEMAIALKEDEPDYHFQHAITLVLQDELEKAVESYDKAILLKVDFAVAYNNKGVALAKLGRHGEAIYSFESAILARHDFHEAHFNLGNNLHAVGRVNEAVLRYTQAIEIKPDYADAFINRGNAFKKLNRFQDSLEDYQSAIVVDPFNYEAYLNLGVSYAEVKRIEEAVSCYDNSLTIKPDYIEAQWNKSLALLLNGEYISGFRLFESRLKRGKSPLSKRDFQRPMWLGVELLKGKSILLHAEQGLGDVIQFCRYAKLVKDLGAKVFLEVPKQLVELLQQLDYVDALIERGEIFPAFDFHCPLMSLPMVFGTELTSIPMSSPYLRADEVKVQYWKAKLVGNSRLKVGLVWNGGFRPDQPELWATNERRNIPLDVFSKSLNFLDADFFSLQKGDPAESEILDREMQYWPDGNLHNYANEINTFTDTAALIANLDIVLSVDTSTAHLAAAMGKPTWILNRYDTCWRWLLDRDDSPWYDAVKLYRQSADMLWEPVLARVVQDFKKIRSKDN